MNELYKGVDLSVYANEQVPLKYDFILAPHAEVSQISMRIDGADALRIKNNALQIVTSVGTVIEQKPYAYQIIDGEKVEVNFMNLICSVLPNLSCWMER